MKFKDFELKTDNHFVAMQYYGLILNKTFLVLITKDLIIGVKVNGLVSVEAGGGNKFAHRLTREIINTMTIKGDLQNPYSYIKSKFIDQVDECELIDESILTQNKSNFIIRREDIANVYYDSKEKWGMGYYPHDGKVYIETKDGGKKEFIILGNQSGQKIVDYILKKNKQQVTPP